jgi:hypothetical protein
MLGLPYVEGSTRLAEAILQHYGAPTHYVDLTSDPEVAAWFALHRAKLDEQIYLGSCFRKLPYICYERTESEYGYVLVLAIPNPTGMEKSEILFSLEDLPVSFVRPFRQKGWLMLDQPPIMPDPNEFWIFSIPLLSKSFRTDLRSTYLFPGPEQDPAFRRLSTLPYVQVPFGYLGTHSDEKPFKEATHEKWYFGLRALDLPEYLETPKEESVNHKWEDYIIFEPDPMRMWRNWRSALSENFPDLNGNIGQATKITIAPAAFALLTAEATAQCSWPSVGADDILFTFAALDHDKVSEHGPTYLGVWLHREGDLILETPIESDEQVMSTTPGHGYLHREGQLSRVQIAKSCQCGKAESHDKRVFSVLQLSRLVKEGKLLFLPHPVLSKLGWFVALSPNESEYLQPRVDRFHRIFTAVLGGATEKPSELDAERVADLEVINASLRRPSKLQKLFLPLIDVGI